LKDLITEISKNDYRDFWNFSEISKKLLTSFLGDAIELKKFNLLVISFHNIY